MVFRILFYWFISVIFLFSSFSMARGTHYDPHPQRGLQTVKYQSPQQYTEECVIPKPYPGTTYTAKALKDMRELCGFSFYDTKARLAVCPKLNSTNPGLEVLSFLSTDADSKVQYEKKYCPKVKNKPGKKIYKYKQSLTCSYTPSPLAYFQLANYLGGVLHIPNLVIRTMDKSEHYKQVLLAKKYARTNYPNPRTIIRQAWDSTWENIHKNPHGSRDKSFPRSTNPESLYTKDLGAIYGSLMENPRNERYYSEVNGRFKYDTRYQTLKNQTPYKNIQNSNHVYNFIPNDFKVAAYRITQMNDMSHMILLDTLLNQQDRVGNISYYDYAYYLLNGKVQSKKVKLINKKLSSSTLTKLKSLGAQQITLIKEMVLKDNDCGVKKSNMARLNNWLEGLHHINEYTYYQILRLAEDVNTQEIKNYFKDELLFNETDWNGGSKKFKSNVEFVAKHLKQKCKSGRLKLDLDLQAFMDGSLPETFTHLCQLPR